MGAMTKLFCKSFSALTTLGSFRTCLIFLGTNVFFSWSIRSSIAVEMAFFHSVNAVFVLPSLLDQVSIVSSKPLTIEHYMYGIFTDSNGWANFFGAVNNSIFFSEAMLQNFRR